MYFYESVIFCFDLFQNIMMAKHKTTLLHRNWKSHKSKCKELVREREEAAAEAAAAANQEGSPLCNWDAVINSLKPCQHGHEIPANGEQQRIEKFTDTFFDGFNECGGGVFAEVVYTKRV